MSVTRYQFKVRGKQFVLATDHDEEVARLKAEVERLTKAVASSPVAQAKLKELEGKTTFEDINPKEVQP